MPARRLREESASDAGVATQSRHRQKGQDQWCEVVFGEALHYPLHGRSVSTSFIQQVCSLHSLRWIPNPMSILMAPKWTRRAKRPDQREEVPVGCDSRSKRSRLREPVLTSLRPRYNSSNSLPAVGQTAKNCRPLVLLSVQADRFSRPGEGRLIVNRSRVARRASRLCRSSIPWCMRRATIKRCDRQHRQQ